MMKSKHVIALAALSAMSGSALTAQAASFTWTAGPGNGLLWSTGFGGTYPQAAADTAVIGPLAGNLTTNIDVANSVMGSLTFGSTGFLTDIGNANATGNALSFNNTGGTGNALIVTTGNSTANSITAPILLLGTTDYGSASLTNLAIGNITASGAARTLNNNASGQTLTLNGTIFTAEAGASTARGLTINSSGNATVNNGNVVLNGAFNTNGVSASLAVVALGSSSTAAGLIRSTITLNADNSAFAGNITLAKANIVLTGDNNLGTGRLLLGGAGAINAFISSSNGLRTIGNSQVQIQQFAAFTGTNPFTFTGKVYQSASRGVTNLMTGGAAVTLAGGTYTANDTTAGRVFIFDGSGPINVTGGLHNGLDPATNLENSASGVYEKRGTGTTTVGGTATYTGATRVRGGNLEFANTAAYSTTAGITADPGSAVGLLTGTLDPAFLTKIATGGGSNFTTPNVGLTTTTLSTDFTSNGALALTNADTATAINYGAGGNLAAANLQGLGIGAATAGANYAGTITPAASTYRLGGGGTLTLTNPTGNQLTGANSVVANNGGTVAIAGSNNYSGGTTIGGVYINPSQEIVRAGQSLSAVTNPSTLRVNSVVSVDTLANGGSASGIGSSSNAASNLVLNGGTLRYTGSGSSTDRLMTVQPNGATLDASGTGAANFTNTGAIVFADAPGRAGIFDTANRQLVYVNDVSDLTVGMTVTGTGVAANTTIRAIIPPTFANIGGTNSNGPYQIVLSTNTTNVATVFTAVPDLAFGGQNRTLSLTGTSTAGNTLSGAIANSATGTTSISKTGAGTWALAGSNTYTGSTSVTAGTLQVNTANSLPSATVLTVGGGAGAATVKLGGNFTQNLSNLTFASGGRFDVGTGILFNNNGGGATALAAARALVISGFNGGAGNGPGYVSSSADASHGVGYKDTGTAIEVRYALYGDADLDGGVSINDFNALANNFGQASGKVWVDGDFDYDGGVSINDFNLLAGNFGQSLPASSGQWAGLLAFAVAHNDLAAFEAVTGVPEPTSLGLMAAGATLALRRRRRA